MPRLGTGLSLGAINTIPGFDFDASSYIIANNISNSQEIRNYSSGKSLVLNELGNSNFCLSTSNQASLGSASSLTTLSSKSWTLAFWISPLQLIASNDSIMLFTKNTGADGNFEWDISFYSTTTNLIEFYFRVSSANSWASIDNWSVPYSNDTQVGNALNNNFANKKTLIIIEWNGPTLTRKIIFNASGHSESIFTRVMSTSPSYSNFGELNLGKNSSTKSVILDEMGHWSRILTTSERQELFNLGDGRKYSELSSGLKTNLVSWWGFDENSGNRADSHGSTTLVQGATSVNSSQPLIGVSEYVNPQALIDKFIKDCKSIGIWANGVFYPLRKGFAGVSGATIYPFGGYNTSFNGTLVNDPSGTASDAGTSTSFSNHPNQFTNSGMLFYSTYGNSDAQQIGLRINLPNGCIPGGTSAVSLFSVAMPFWKETGGFRGQTQTSNTRQRFISTGNGNTSTDGLDVGTDINNDGTAGASWDGLVQKTRVSKYSQLLPKFDLVNATTTPSISYYYNASLVGSDTTLTAGYTRSGNWNRIGTGGTSAGAYAGANGYVSIAGFFNKNLTATEITNLYNSLKSTLAYGFNLP